MFRVKWVKSHASVLESLVYVVGHGCTTWNLTLADTAPLSQSRSGLNCEAWEHLQLGNSAHPLAYSILAAAGQFNPPSAYFSTSGYMIIVHSQLINTMQPFPSWA